MLDYIKYKYIHCVKIFAANIYLAWHTYNIKWNPLIQKSLKVKKAIVCVFLDIENATDNTSQDFINGSLDKRCIELMTSKSINEVLYARSAQTYDLHSNIRDLHSNEITKVTTKAKYYKVLTPLKWSVVVYGLLTKPSKAGVAEKTVWRL